MKRVESQPNLTQQVYQAILDDICEGALAPGMHLVQEELADKLGVSRQPVQQAMALLKSDGVVQEQGRRGLYVAPLDPTVMRHHYEIRAALDGLAARLTAERVAAAPEVSAEIANRGAAIVTAGAAAAEAGAVKRMVRHDVAFHAFLYEASGNPLLAPTAAPHWRYLRRVMGEVLRHAERGSTIWEQHRDILAAVVRGDAEAAVGHATGHVKLAADRLAGALERGGGEKSPDTGAGDAAGRGTGRRGGRLAVGGI